MPDPPPLRPDIFPPGAPPPPGRSSGSSKQLLWGLLLGSAVSAIIWVAGWNLLMGTGRSADYLLLVVPGVKVLAGLACLTVRSVRSFGVGILLSIAVGFLIFFGSCFVHIATG